MASFFLGVLAATNLTQVGFILNFRDSLVLGLVGAGGIGFYIRAFQYDKVATLTVVVLLVVVFVEQISVAVRQRLR